MWLPPKDADRPYRIGFLLISNFSNYAFMSGVEPLRMANQLAQEVLYEWPILSLDGRPVTASNGLAVNADHGLGDHYPVDILFVCGGLDLEAACNETVYEQLWKLDRHGTALGGLCTGSYLLARAGLLDGYRATIHWQNISSILEEMLFPRITFVQDLFVVDRYRYTCSGGIAPLDLMLNIVRQQQGSTLAEAISEEYLHERIRQHQDVQRHPLRTHLKAEHPRMEDAVRLMENNLDEPLPLDELAWHVGVSRRQLERLFRKYTNTSPTRFYLSLRLQRARELLLQTDKPIIDVAVACGFSSASHFSKCYRDFFRQSPTAERWSYRQTGAAAEP